MLTPQQILEIIDTLYPQIDELNTWIMADIIKRLMARLGRGKLYMTATDDWQLQVYQSAGGHLDAVQQEIKRWTKATDAEVKRIFEDAGIKALAYDSNFYIEHGLAGIELAQSESMIRLLEDTYQRTVGTVHNFTRTTAEASQQQLIKVLDAAHFKVNSGAASYTQAVEEAVSSIVDTQTKVFYPSGHVDTIETAVLRAVRTGVAQAAGNMAVQGMEERDWDVVLVSAHIGARYGDGGKNPGNHFWWQGKHYSRTGRTPDLPLFVESTGYGTGEGLCGWNCRHSFGPGDIRHNPFAQFDTEENKKVYDLSQRQRTMESRIRRSKAKLVGLRTAIDAAQDAETKAALEDKYATTARLLERQNISYNQFCEDNSLKRLGERIQIAQWTREDARKSIAAVRKSK
nr:MAG TPA: minor capsid protein [Caudoviricetes sp.]